MQRHYAMFRTLGKSVPEPKSLLGKLTESCETVDQVQWSKERRAALVSKQQLQTRPDYVYRQKYLKGQHCGKVLGKCLQEGEYGRMDTQLHGLTEILLVFRYSNMVWGEGLVPQFGEDNESEEPVWWSPASCIGGNGMATGPNIQCLHCPNCN
jgi:hypothetical protein